jgi:hypothetical protein
MTGLPFPSKLGLACAAFFGKNMRWRPFCARPTTAKELAWSLNKARLGTPAMSDGKILAKQQGRFCHCN